MGHHFFTLMRADHQIRVGMRRAQQDKPGLVILIKVSPRERLVPLALCLDAPGA